MADAKTFQLSVVTPEGAVLDTEARSAVFPASDGEVGVLPNRAPLLARLGIGVLKATTDGGIQRFYVEGGFAQVIHNKLTLLTEYAVPLEELKPETAEESLQMARAMASGDTQVLDAKNFAMERARVQKRLTAHHRQ
jgi:F-type H+-transporting ATPase subunit epsilon